MFFGSVGAGTVERKDFSFFCVVLLGYCIIGFSQKEWILNKNLQQQELTADIFFTWMMEGLESQTSNGE